MGAVHFSIDGRLLARLREQLPLEVFVETGTYEGASVDTALPYFGELHTIELSEEFFARAAARFEDSPAVHVHHGSSSEVLSRLSGRLRQRPVLYWLDAHFCAHRSAGAELQCPLLAELDAIGPVDVRSVIMIDDARLFTAPPPAPFIAEQWPSLTNVLGRLSRNCPAHELMVIDDVIVLFPPQIREALRGFAREHAIDWFLALAGARRLDHTVEPLERIATRLERQGEIAGRGCAAMRSLDARLDNLRAQLEAVNDQMAVLDLELRAVETSVRKLSVREAGTDSQELEEPNWSLDSIQVTREKLAALSTGQREVRQLVQAQADGLAEALTQAHALLEQQTAIAAEIAAVHAKVAEQATQARISHRILEQGGITQRTRPRPAAAGGD